MKIFTLALPVLALSALFPAKSGAAVRGVSLHVTSAAKFYTSGAVMPVRAYFRNQAKLPLTFCQFRPAPEYTFLCRGTYGPHAAQVAPTAFGREAVRPWSSNGFSFTPIGLIAPGNSGDYRHPIPVGQYLDTTLARTGVLPHFPDLKSYRAPLHFNVKDMTLRQFLTTGMVYQMNPQHFDGTFWQVTYVVRHGKFTGRVDIMMQGWPVSASVAAGGLAKQTAAKAK